MDEVRSYAETRARFFRKEAMRWVLRLFDEGAYAKHCARPLPSNEPNQPGIAYAREMGWLEGESAYWLTSNGITLAAELASEREDWLLSMAEKLKDGGS